MSDAPGPTVVLVDDDKFLLDMYTAKFLQRGYSVQAFLSADDALKTLAGGLAPDAILFDLTMPEKDGLTFLQEMVGKKFAPNALKVALTNQSSDEERQKLLSTGANEYIVKATMVPSEVVNTIERLLSSSRA